MLFGKDLNRRSIRSASPKARSLSGAQQILSLFKIEFFSTIADEEHFFVGHVRANHLVEALSMMGAYANRRGSRNYRVHRKFDLGKDRSWLRGGARDYKVKVLEVKRYDLEIYETCRNEGPYNEAVLCAQK